VGASNVQMLPEWNRFWYHTDCCSHCSAALRAQKPSEQPTGLCPVGGGLCKQLIERRAPRLEA
jgi:hypothetical protein